MEFTANQKQIKVNVKFKGFNTKNLNMKDLQSNDANQNNDFLIYMDEKRFQ